MAPKPTTKSHDSAFGEALTPIKMTTVSKIIESVSNFCFMVLLLLLLSACRTTDIKNQTISQIDVADTYSVETTAPVETSLPWWTEFGRPALDALVEQALAENLEVAQSIARLRQAQSITKQTESGLFPQIDALTNARDEWEGSDGQEGEIEVGAAVEWEIDAFGRVSNTARSDALRAQARLEEIRALQLFLSAEVANAYFGAVAAQRTLELLNQQVMTDQELLELLELRFESGIGNNVEVLQQQSRVAESQNLIPATEANRRVFENRLDVLLGETPDAVNRVSDHASLDFATQLPAIGVPAALLVNRPDLRAARAELSAADAAIEAAIADRLPRIILNGSYVYSDTDTFSGPLATIMGMFVQPLLDWGRRKAEVERNEAIYEERLAAFTQLYLEAVEAVENALYQENRQREFILKLEQRRHILQETVDESEARYTQGVDDYLPVLNALQELREVERDLVSEHLNLINFRIALHRAVGGTIPPLRTQEE